MMMRWTPREGQSLKDLAERVRRCLRQSGVHGILHIPRKVELEESNTNGRYIRVASVEYDGKKAQIELWYDQYTRHKNRRHLWYGYEDDSGNQLSESLIGGIQDRLTGKCRVEETLVSSDWTDEGRYVRLRNQLAGERFGVTILEDHTTEDDAGPQFLGRYFRAKHTEWEGDDDVPDRILRFIIETLVAAFPKGLDKRTTGGGQGRSHDEDRKKAIERCAAREAKRYFQGKGFRVSKYHQTGPYDYICRKDGKKVYVEAKGSSSSPLNQIEMTANEVKHIRKNPGRCILFALGGIKVVKGPSGKLEGRPPQQREGNQCVIEQWRIEGKDLTPMQYVYRLPSC